MVVPVEVFDVGCRSTSLLLMVMLGEGAVCPDPVIPAPLGPF